VKPLYVAPPAFPARRHALAILASVAFLAPLVPGTARADVTPAPLPVAEAQGDQHGLVVLGLGASLDAAWPLARAVYADASLRPVTLDEAHARVLVGETPGAASTADLRDLADTRAAIHGDDAASRRLLASIALALHVKGVLVVESGASPESRATARVFVTTAGAYDAVRYEADTPAPVTWGNGASAVTWHGAVTALHRGFADVAAPSASAPNVPPLATHAVVQPTTPAEGKAGDAGKARAFYQSPWFWAAAGAAVFAAGAVYFATRNDGTDNIQLQVQVPK
jgi:hypothetical protein